jgi:hypothetical protein
MPESMDRAAALAREIDADLNRMVRRRPSELAGHG